MATTNLKAFPEQEQAVCPKCEHEITLYDPAGSEFCVCGNCRTYLQFNAQDVPVTRRKLAEPAVKPVFELGTRGVINETEFIVIAFAIRREAGTQYAWREYLLYNYEKGYANLAEYDGHWNFVAGKNFYPDLDDLRERNWSFSNYLGDEYKLFNKYVAETVYLMGECDWDYLTEQPKVKEYIAPPYILFSEKVIGVSDSYEFYWGQYVEPKELAEAFKIHIGRFPNQIGIGANQSSKHQDRFAASIKFTVFLAALLAVIGLFTANVHPEREVFNGGFEIQSDTAKIGEFKPFKTPKFRVGGPSSALDFLIYSNVDNSWVEATMVLVNEATNQTWEVTKSVEYYRGYEGGENWSEGSQEAEAVLSAIPEGYYHLNIYPATEGINIKTINISVLEKVVLWRNFWITLLAIVIYPIYCWFRMLNFEKRRWMNSDYSPYEADS